MDVILVNPMLRRTEKISFQRNCTSIGIAQIHEENVECSLLTKGEEKRESDDENRSAVHVVELQAE